MAGPDEHAFDVLDVLEVRLRAPREPPGSRGPAALRFARRLLRRLRQR